MYRLVALDIDGTVLDSRGEIRPRVLAAVGRAIQAGVAVTLATGRRWRAARDIASRLGIRVPVILYNGALVLDPVRESVLREQPLPPDAALDAMRHLERHGLPVYVCRHAPSGPDLYWLGEPASPAAAYFREGPRGHARPLEDVAGAAGLDVLKVFTLDLEARVRPAATETPRWLGVPLRSLLCPDIPGHSLLEYWRWGTDKGSALEFLAYRLGVRRSEIVAVGDNWNDMEMIDFAGLGVAMANAVPELRQRADLVTASNDEDGVAAVLERYVLGEVA